MHFTQIFIKRELFYMEQHKEEIGTRRDLVLYRLETYSRLTDGVEASLDESDKCAEEDDRRYTHDEVFSNLRRRING